MCAELSLFQVVCGALSAVCLVGGTVSACAFFVALAWEYTRHLRPVSYQCTVRRYIADGETLRARWGFVPLRRSL